MSVGRGGGNPERGGRGRSEALGTRVENIGGLAFQYAAYNEDASATFGANVGP